MLHENLPIYLKKVAFKTEKKDGETRKICQLNLVIAPFTATMAEELGGSIRRHLFKTTDATADEEMAEARFNLSVTSLQELRIKTAPDQSPGEAIIIPNVRVSKQLRVRRDKETPTYEARFHVDFPYPIPETLQYLANNQNEQIIVSFQDEQMNMLEEQRPPSRRKPKLTQPPLAGAAPPEAAAVQ